MLQNFIFITFLLFCIGSVSCDGTDYKFVRSKYNNFLRSTTNEPTTEPEVLNENSSITTTNNREENIVEDDDDDKGGNEPNLSTQCGEQTAENHPWIAVLEHTDPNNSKSKKKTLSKGILISRQHVLTTVSSIHNSHPFWVVSSVRLGDTPTWATDKTLRKREQVQRYDIEEVYIHEYKDIAVIKLDKKINITEAVRPICLPRSFLHMEHKEMYQHVCKRIKNVPLRDGARVVTVSATPLSARDCHIYFRRKGATLTDDEFCAWDESGDSCTGDLGGPLIGKTAGRFYVVGLNSYVLTSADLKDDKSAPGVYTRIASHLKWIKKLIETSSDEVL